ncbi:hypothetical protein ACVIQT_005967 [Bradyrhizobium diazoefficiens]
MIDCEVNLIKNVLDNTCADSAVEFTELPTRFIYYKSHLSP